MPRRPKAAAATDERQKTDNTPPAETPPKPGPEPLTIPEIRPRGVYRFGQVEKLLGLYATTVRAERSAGRLRSGRPGRTNGRGAQAPERMERCTRTQRPSASARASRPRW
jgi:hypothetical protein